MEIFIYNKWKYDDFEYTGGRYFWTYIDNNTMNYSIFSDDRIPITFTRGPNLNL